MAIIFSCSQNE
uniref:Uncharacterized protein n=1 Tax=Timema monikensis TaxID=170555 RepID=A0A7R9EDL2_9NEOP|nr:unnamed protein product [Timema monikensis]